MAVGKGFALLPLDGGGAAASAPSQHLIQLNWQIESTAWLNWMQLNAIWLNDLMEILIKVWLDNLTGALMDQLISNE